MFAKLNNRLCRSIAAVVIPVGMILGTAQSSFADRDGGPRWDHHDEHHDRWSRMYRAESNGAPVTVELTLVSGDTIQGVLTVGATEFPFGGRFDGSSYRGVIAMGRDCYAFCATFDSGVLHFQCNSADLVLQAC